jgi:site-specific DNA recombinase
MKAKLIEIEREKEIMEAEIEGFANADTLVSMHPSAVEAYRRKVTELQAALKSDEREMRQAMDIVRSLVSKIEVMPLAAPGQVELRVCGALAELLNLPNRKRGEPPSAVSGSRHG